LNHDHPHPADTVPNDGRVIRGWFRFQGGARLVAVSWSDEKQHWIDLLGQSIPAGEVLTNWGED
jgi:hypothetical protein